MKLFPQVKEFFFDDDTFNIRKARTIELCAKLKPLGLTWSCTSRVTTDYETLKAMKDAGCRLLIVGFESGDPQILKNIKKGATVGAGRKFMQGLQKAGPDGPRRLHHRPSGRNQGDHPSAPSTSPRNWTAKPSRSPWPTPTPAPSSTNT